ncbi:hypothetical protein, partial [Nonomuraea sp. NPDC003201]
MQEHELDRVRPEPHPPRRKSAGGGREPEGSSDGGTADGGRSVVVSISSEKCGRRSRRGRRATCSPAALC